MLKAVVFDFDGLIVDTESVWYDVTKEAMLEYGCTLTIEDFAVCIGTTDDVLFSRLTELSPRPFDRADIKRKTRELYSHQMANLSLREGVIEYLQTAQRMGLKIGLASSSNRQWVEGFLERFQIKHFFEVIKTSDDVQNVKPDPELYLQAIAELGVIAQETLAFEDSKNGLTAAVKAGIHCVIVPNQVTNLLNFSGHVHRLTSMGEIGMDVLFTQLEAKLLR